MNCLLCHSPYNPIASWRQLLLLEEPDVLCPRCRGTFAVIRGRLCEMCGRLLEEAAPSVCADCLRWQEDEQWGRALVKNRSVYLYNDWMKDVVALWKFRGDYVIVEAFRRPFVQAFRRHFGRDWCIVPIPLSPERLHERGFNQAEALARLLPSPYFPWLSRKHSEKQSKKSRRERLETDNPFFLADHPPLDGKRIVLIDDIYTTGITVRHAARILLEAGAAEVGALTLVRA
ncbi:MULTISPECIES: ComF family protein [Geobacillus]|uniref:Amidophosphoribosyltransferase n=1 Tax=Geobacillus thermocatenulatus TaxID=33938 RepID=A0A226QBM2_9BACL|nr:MULTISPECIES: ComF family protein [Geobacillus]ASS98172.1 amidophosphoribosyltransferase [Geobacillus thermocatenulatus]KLR74482.1 phosphoribosyltransferase [Geobacillus sp. T6]OXB88930.1 amidophosphoribosyltransferase [Geobacillus thermocatenulatus]